MTKADVTLSKAGRAVLTGMYARHGSVYPKRKVEIAVARELLAHDLVEECETLPGVYRITTIGEAWADKYLSLKEPAHV